ncbi:MAG: two-component system response regulator [Dehalococcoidia bacterium]|jgi:putative two-component system response regulator
MATAVNDQSTILLVDDEIRNVEILKSYLEPVGYKVLSVASGEKAIKCAFENYIDLILLDVMMPGMDGFETTRRLKSSENTSFIPIILVTVLSEKKERVKGIESGCDDFLNKPVDKLELLARVKSLIKVKAYNEYLRNYKHELESEVAKRTKELKKALLMIEESSLETIYRLSMAAEYKDTDTGAHIFRISHSAAAIARKFGLDKDTTKSILYAAPMHDIGKIGIPDSILLKPGKLDSEEWEVMKRHAVIGANILKGSKQNLINVAEVIARTHHEKWDGTGYPKGLKGEAIPLPGRIVAVADVFDALISKRPYKEPYPPDRSFGIIENSKGAHFDPNVVDAFLNIKREILSIVEKYKDYP